MNQRVIGPVVRPANSVTRSEGLEGDAPAPGNSQYYGTDGAGEKGFHALPAGGGDFDQGDILVKNSVEKDGADSDTIQLVGDAAAPGGDKVYGTNAGGDKGWYDRPDAPAAGAIGFIRGTGAAGGSAAHSGASVNELVLIPLANNGTGDFQLTLPMVAGDYLITLVATIDVAEPDTGNALYRIITRLRADATALGLDAGQLVTLFQDTGDLVQVTHQHLLAASGGEVIDAMYALQVGLGAAPTFFGVSTGQTTLSYVRA